MSDAVTAQATDPDVEALDALCRDLAEAADAVGEAARYASGLALGARLPAAALAGCGGGRSRRAWRTLLRTLTDPAGLGWAPRGRGVARAGWFAGILARRENLAVTTAVCGLKARIHVAGLGRPDLLANPDCAAVLRAVAEGRQDEAARAFRTLLRERGAGEAFTLLAPTFADVLAWHALTDENPFNDHAGWQVATGRAVTAEPLLGLGAALRAFFSRGDGTDDGPGPGSGAGLLEALDTSGTLAGYVGNTGLLGATDTLLVQRVTGPGGRPRHVLQLADRDAWRVRDVVRAVRGLIPSGAELVLVGHRLGAVTAMDLARDRDLTAVYRITHLYAVGSPADARTPLDPRTRVHRLASAGAIGGAGSAAEGRVTGSRLLPLGDAERPRTTTSRRNP